ncbi:MAG: proline--tRNA ligase [Myxococcota bacterium]
MSQKTPERITPRSEDYARWYQDVIRQGQLAESAEVVKGCMVIKPHGFAIWEKIQRGLDDRFKETGHQNAYFPLLIPESFIRKEAEHVEGFSPELAVVTQAGGRELDEPYVIRPTSETIIGHFFSRWIESHRDLPLLINQWANVMRWELRTRMFLRTSEFLWQEGHTAHATHAEAKEEVQRMLDVYADFAEQTMAMPVHKGIKSESEKFAGALASYSIEAMMQDGKALQAGTSHDLGQNFGKAFNVRFQNAEGQMDYVWQTSWGCSTRLIGGLIMTHSDDNGLVLPPALAPVQVVIVPIYGKGGDEAEVREHGARLVAELKGEGLSVVFDTRDYKPGFKYFEWEQKGVPVRLELGPKDIKNSTVALKGRIAEKKEFVPRAGIASHLREYLDTMQKDLFDRALRFRDDRTVSIDSWDDFEAAFDGDENRFVHAHWDGTRETEAAIKNDLKVTIRNIPVAGDPEPGRCVKTGRVSERRVIFARAY